MPSIAYIVARSVPQHVIGCENQLPWRLRTDMRFFKSVTLDHAVILGRKTYDSIGHPLADRMNIVLSRNPGNSSTNIRWVADRESALFAADLYSILNSKPYIIVMGGEKVYSMFDKLVNKVFLTEVNGKFDGDAYFRMDFRRNIWELVESIEYPASPGDEYSFAIKVFERRRKYVRQCELSEFMSRDISQEIWSRERLAQKFFQFKFVEPEQFALPMPYEAT